MCFFLLRRIDSIKSVNSHLKRSPEVSKENAKKILFLIASIYIKICMKIDNRYEYRTLHTYFI